MNNLSNIFEAIEKQLEEQKTTIAIREYELEQLREKLDKAEKEIEALDNLIEKWQGVNKGNEEN